MRASDERGGDRQQPHVALILAPAHLNLATLLPPANLSSGLSSLLGSGCHLLSLGRSNVCRRQDETVRAKVVLVVRLDARSSLLGALLVDEAAVHYVA